MPKKVKEGVAINEKKGNNQMVRRLPMVISMSVAIWYSKLKWRISIERHAWWWEAILPINWMLLLTPVWS